MGNHSPIKIKDDLTESTNNIVETVLTPIQDIHKGIKKIFAVCTGKWFADMERPTALVAAQTEKDVEDIKAGKKEFRDGNLIPIGPVVDAGDYYREINAQNSACDAKRLGEAMLDAAIELKEIPEEDISDDPVDQTFFNHWRREAELIDDDELRKWWAHLLVEETKNPQSISPRTLDVAKDLSKDEAQLFARMAKSIVVQTLLVDHKSEPLGGTYGELLSLQDAGLVSSMISNRDFLAGDEESHNSVLLPFFDCNLVIAFKYNKISIRCYILTKAGKEIDSISHKGLSLDEIKAIAEEISKQNNNAIGFIYQMYNVSDDPNNARYIHYDVDWDHPIWTNHLETN